MTLQEIQQKINQIKSQMPSLKQKVGQLVQSRGQSVVNPPAPPKPAVQLPSGGATTFQVPKRNVLGKLNTGGSIVDYLKSTGKPSNFGYRSQLAKQYGVTNYGGAAPQNTRLLNALRAGAKPSVGTWIDAKTGLGYSGPKQKEGDIPASPTTGKPLNQQVSGGEQPSNIRIGSQTGGTTKTIGETTGEKMPSLTKGAEPKDVVQSYIDKYLGKIDYSALADQAKAIAEETYQPIENKLKDIITNIKNSYIAAQKDLTASQQKEAEDLKGAYAVRGLSNSGVYQQALQDLQKKHLQELNDLTQKESQDITNISYEVASKKPDAINNILKTMQSELASQRNRASILLGSLLSNQLTNQREKAKGKQVATSTTITDKDGNKYLVLLDANGNEIKRMYVGQATSTEPLFIIEDGVTKKKYDVGKVPELKEFIKDHPGYNDWQKMGDYMTIYSKIPQARIKALLRSVGLKEPSKTLSSPEEIWKELHSNSTSTQPTSPTNKTNKSIWDYLNPFNW